MPDTGGCRGRGLLRSPIRRSGSEVSSARAATAQRRTPLLPKVAAMPTKSLGRGPGPGLGVGGGGLLCPFAELWG